MRRTVSNRDWLSWVLSLVYLYPKVTLLALADVHLSSQASEFSDCQTHSVPVVCSSCVFEIHIDSDQLKLLIHGLPALDVPTAETVVTAMAMLPPQNADMALRFWADLLRELIMFEEALKACEIHFFSRLQAYGVRVGQLYL